MQVNYTALLIASSIVKGLAVIITLFRLGFRLKIQRFWWEDVWAGVALLCTVGSIISALALFAANNYELNFTASRIDRYIFTTLVWSVRMSLVFSVMRIVSTILQRRITFALTVYIFLCWAVTLSVQAWWCAKNPPARSLLEKALPGCVLPRFEIVFELATNVSADMMNVIFALRVLWRVKLPRRQRRMFLCLFSSSKFLCLFSSAQLITQLVGTQSVQYILSELQLGAFMIVCNLLVLVTYVYRVFLSYANEDVSTISEPPSNDDDFTTPAPRGSSTQYLTTVDLEAYTGSSEISSELRSIFFCPTTTWTPSKV